MKKATFLLLIILIFNSCKEEKGEEILAISTSEEIMNNGLVIIVKNPLKIKTNIGSGIDAKSFTQIGVDFDKKQDTIRLDFENYKKLYIRKENFTRVLFSKVNDTLNLVINKQGIKINFLNRNLKKYDTVSLTKVYQRNIRKEIIAYNKLFNFFYAKDSKTNTIKSSIGKIESSQKLFKKLDSLAEIKLIRKINVLKKLFEKEQISEPNYFSEKSNLNYKYFSSLIKNYSITKDNYYINKIHNLYFKNEVAFNDAFISYGYVNSFILDIVLESSVLDANYKVAFDKLPEFFKENQLKFFREFCLHQMAQKNESSKQVISYFEKYKSLYTDSTFVKSFNKKYLLDLKVSNISSKNIELLNVKQENKRLEHFIKENKGSVIYVDFWASWCAPCLLEMPFSKELQKDYKNKKIVFLYISTDKDREAWLKASKKLNLDNNYDYLAVNYPDADFYKQLELNTIPRYLLYNKNGELMYEDAPRPSSKELRNLVNELLE